LPVRDVRHLAEVAVDIQRYRSHSTLLAVVEIGEGPVVSAPGEN
jgi:hypothetical protein